VPRAGHLGQTLGEFWESDSGAFRPGMNRVELVADLNTPHSWYALYTRHQHEKSVHHVLTGKGFEAFLPLYTTANQWKDRIKRVSLPLFPCYVFLRGPLLQWLPVLSTPGVHAVVGSGGYPATILDSEIDAIRRVLESPLSVEPHPFLKCGDRVRVTAGPLRGLEGLLLRKKNWCKLLLSVDMLQRSVAVEIDAAMVERIGGRKQVAGPSSMRPSWSGALA
jgi:transcription antitermination factor NusG